MPWMETCPVEERVRFVNSVVREGWGVTAACLAFGVSRKTGHKWLLRYQELGLEGLYDLSRARHTQEHAVAEPVRRLVTEARQLHPTWGPKKLRPWLLRRHPGLELPSLTTMATILRDAELVKPRRRGQRLKGPQGAGGGEDRPNGVWAVDFKGQFRLGDGSLCYPLTVSDVCSRYLLACRGLEDTSWPPVRRAFERLFRERGLPERLRSDNGVPFASRGPGRLSRLAVWWIDLGIGLQRITPGRPQENGRHERMHRTLKRETAAPPASSARAQQTRFDRFRVCFNEDRPHEALGQECPAQHYEPSRRPYPEHIGPPEYPGHYERRSVRAHGAIKWGGELVYVSECLVGRAVGLVEVEEDRWEVYYRDHPVGTLGREGRRLRVRPIGTPDPGT